MSHIKVNGDAQEVTLPITLSALIAQNKVSQPEMVTVQLNGEFVERADFAVTQLKAGDEVDFLYFMGGGQPWNSQPNK